MKLTEIQVTILKAKISEEYAKRVNKLNEIRQRHVTRLIEMYPCADNMDRMRLYRSVIRDIDEAVKNHESMRDQLLAEIGGSDESIGKSN